VGGGGGGGGGWGGGGGVEKEKKAAQYGAPDEHPLVRLVSRFYSRDPSKQSREHTEKRNKYLNN